MSAGLARATEEPVGRRPRTVYAITPKGHRALRPWLAAAGAGPVLEFEQLLKLFFADQGTKADALGAIASIRAWAEREEGEHIAVARGYLAGTGAFPERVAVTALTGTFLVAFTDMVANWADWAETVVATWPDDTGRAEPDWTILEAAARRAIRPD